MCTARLSIIILALIVGSARAQSTRPQTTHPTMTRKRTPPPTREEIELAASQLYSADTQDQAMKTFAEWITYHPRTVADYLRIWCDPMMKNNRFGPVAAYMQNLTEDLPIDVDTIVDLQAYRAHALRYQGAWDRALFVAKGLYNVAPLERIAVARFVMIKCLKDAHPNDDGIIERFKNEQAAGDAPPTTTTSAPADHKSVLDSINAPPQIAERYDKAIKRFHGNSYRGQVSRGNLLLLADRLPEARTCFETALQLAGQKDLPAATENLARLMKAEDGATGRATAWLAAHQIPTTAPAASN